MIEKLHQLFPAQDDGELAGPAHARKIFIGPEHLQRVKVEKLHSRNILIDALRGEFLLVDEVKLVLADRFQVQNLRALAEILGEVGHIMDIVSLSGRREIAQLHIFDHALTKWCHAIAP